MLEAIIKRLIPLTFDYNTSRDTHNKLGEIIKRRCEEAKAPKNGLNITETTILKVANIKGNEWMLPIELDSIKRGLKFGELEYANATYTGYLNADGLSEGAGVTFMNDG